jgi:hypothetical protein
MIVERMERHDAGFKPGMFMLKLEIRYTLMMWKMTLLLRKLRNVVGSIPYHQRYEWKSFSFTEQRPYRSGARKRNRPWRRLGKALPIWYTSSKECQFRSLLRG